MRTLPTGLFLTPTLAFAQGLHAFSNDEVVTDAEKINEDFNALKSAISNGVNSPHEDGAVYGSPVWIESNRTAQASLAI